MDTETQLKQKLKEYSRSVNKIRHLIQKSNVVSKATESTKPNAKEIDYYKTRLNSVTTIQLIKLINEKKSTNVKIKNEAYDALHDHDILKNKIIKKRPQTAEILKEMKGKCVKASIISDLGTRPSSVPLECIQIHNPWDGEEKYTHFLMINSYELEEKQMVKYGKSYLSI